MSEKAHRTLYIWTCPDCSFSQLSMTAPVLKSFHSCSRLMIPGKEAEVTPWSFVEAGAVMRSESGKFYLRPAPIGKSRRRKSA